VYNEKEMSAFVKTYIKAFIINKIYWILCLLWTTWIQRLKSKFFDVSAVTQSL